MIQHTKYKDLIVSQAIQKSPTGPPFQISKFQSALIFMIKQELSLGSGECPSNCIHLCSILIPDLGLHATHQNPLKNQKNNDSKTTVGRVIVLVYCNLPNHYIAIFRV